MCTVLCKVHGLKLSLSDFLQNNSAILAFTRSSFNSVPNSYITGMFETLRCFRNVCQRPSQGRDCSGYLNKSTEASFVGWNSMPTSLKRKVERKSAASNPVDSYLAEDMDQVHQLLRLIAVPRHFTLFIPEGQLEDTEKRAFVISKQEVESDGHEQKHFLFFSILFMFARTFLMK